MCHSLFHFVFRMQSCVLLNDFFGNYYGGEYFDDGCAEGRKISSMVLHKSEFYGPTVIRAIEVTYSDGAKYTHGRIPDANDETADSYSIELGDDETIIAAAGYSGRLIDSIAFVTVDSTGEPTIYGPFGGDGGERGFFVYRNIVSLRGRAQDAIDAIGFNIRV